MPTCKGPFPEFPHEEITYESEYCPACRFINALAMKAVQWIEEKGKAEHLQTIVKKLPKTADGVPVVPDMMLWCADGNVGRVTSMGYRVVQIDSEKTYEASVYCYSTEAAALAAKENKN